MIIILESGDAERRGGGREKGRRGRRVENSAFFRR